MAGGGSGTRGGRGRVGRGLARDGIDWDGVNDGVGRDCGKDGVGKDKVGRGCGRGKVGRGCCREGTVNCLDRVGVDSDGGWDEKVSLPDEVLVETFKVPAVD